MDKNVFNYKIIELKNKTNLCFVFFSSNGIINGKRSLEDVVQDDYYEFLNVASCRSVLKKASKIIFLRDLELNFYVNGISKTIDSISSIINFLREKTNGFDVVAVGYSAGGYMATICGLELDNVKRVYSFGGVFNLYSWKGSHLETSFLLNNVLVSNQNNKTKEKYYNIIPSLLNNKTKANFYHFFANKSESDLLVLNELKMYNLPSNFHFVELNSTKHGGQLSFYDYVGLLSKSINYSLVFKKSSYSKLQLSIKLQGLLKYLINLIRNTIYKRGKTK